MKVDRELDYHGYSVKEMLADLDSLRDSPTWRGLERVRVIHGKGEKLAPAVRAWCTRRQVSWYPEPFNEGAVVLHPGVSPSDPAIEKARDARTRTHAQSTPRCAARASSRQPSHEERALFERELRRLEQNSRGSVRRFKEGT